MAKSDLITRIDRVCGHSQKLGLMVHAIAVECLTHALEHGDPRPLDRLVKGLHASCRPAALMEWAKKFSPVTWNGEGVVGIIQKAKPNYKPFDIASATDEPYWTPSEIVAKPLTLDALKKMIAQIESKVAKAEAGKLEIADGENIVDMRAFAERAKMAVAA